MFVLIQKLPHAVREGKSGYVMTWRGKQLAICESREPLQKWIDAQGARREQFYIEEQPGTPRNHFD